MGDGSLVEMTRSEIKADLEAGTQLAAKRAKVPELAQDELDHLLDIYASAARFTAVDIGDEVVAGFALALVSLGFVTTTTMRAFTPQQIGAIVSKLP